MASAAVSPKKLNTALTEKDRQFRSKEFFVNTPYDSLLDGKPWNDTFKGYVETLENNQKKLDYLRYLEHFFTGGGFANEKDYTKKKTTWNNRLKQIKIETYAAKNSDKKKITKVGCVIIDASGNVLVNRTESQEEGKEKSKKIQYGFPKGDIEYTIGATLDTVTRESPLTGALRELEEETGIVKHGDLLKNGSGSGVYLQQVFDLEGKHVESARMPLVAWREVYDRENYYLVLSVSRPPTLVLEPYLTDSNKSEGIRGLEWKRQATHATYEDFNSFSRKPMVFSFGPSPMGGPGVPSSSAAPAGGAGGSSSGNWRSAKRGGGGTRKRKRKARA